MKNFILLFFLFKLSVGFSQNATISGIDTGSVIEDNLPVDASGTLTITDPDGPTEESFVTQTNTPGTYGTFSLDVAGAWTYAGNNNTMQQLAQGMTIDDIFVVFSFDGTTHNVTITITGTNDAPIIFEALDLFAVEDGSTVSGTVTPIDFDINDTFTFLASQPVEGSVSIDNNTGTYFFNPDNGFQYLSVGETNNVTFDVSVMDNNGASDMVHH